MKALCGYATLWNKIILHHNVWKMVLPHAFDDAIISGRTIKLLLHHSDNECVGSTNDILQLHSDAYGIAFRARLPDTEHGRTARRMAEGDNNSMSIGFDWHNARRETRRINGKDVVCIIAADLYEVSFLYGQEFAAVKQAHVVYKDCDYSKSLRDECSGGRFLYDGAAIGFTRTLQKLMNT